MTKAERDQAIRVAFLAVFGVPERRSKEQMIVMAWMARFCRKSSPTYTGDRDHALFLEGRREVLLEIERRILEPSPSVDQILNFTGESNDD